MGVGIWTIKAQGVGESLASLVLRARLIFRRSSREACGVCGPLAHASRIASTSAFSAAKFRSALAAGDGPSAMVAGDCSGPGGDESDARGFVDAVDERTSSFLSLVSGSGMVMMNFSRPETSQNVLAPLAPC